MAKTREHADWAFADFVERFEAKYPKATRCLKKDRANPLALYDFAAQH